MTTSEDYFVKYWNLDLKVEILNFHSEEDLFAWIQSHKGDKFSVHKATCLLDFS